MMNYSTETKPERIGSHYNCDVMEESLQKVLVLGENLTSFTSTCLILDQRRETLRNSICILTSRMRLSKDQLTIRVDAHSNLKSLSTDTSLDAFSIKIYVGHAKNVNKNSVAEKAIRELRQEIVKLSPSGGKVSSRTLALATDNLNSRIRHSGRSSKELWTSRDQNTGENLAMGDKQLSDQQHKMRTSSHLSSSKYSARGAPPVIPPSVEVGDIVFIKSDRSKAKARDSYVVLVVNLRKAVAKLQKFPQANFRENIITVQLQNIFLPPSKQGCQQESQEETPVVIEDNPPLKLKVKVKLTRPKKTIGTRRTAFPHWPQMTSISSPSSSDSDDESSSSDESGDDSSSSSEPDDESPSNSESDNDQDVDQVDNDQVNNDQVNKDQVDNDQFDNDQVDNDQVDNNQDDDQVNDQDDDQDPPRALRTPTPLRHPGPRHQSPTPPRWFPPTRSTTGSAPAVRGRQNRQVR
jgi:hypothetical protein